jgi:uncharacterized protein YjbJ (UPF0337 family)
MIYSFGSDTMDGATKDTLGKVTDDAVTTGTTGF